MGEPIPLLCPICRGVLQRGEKSLCCGKNHSFDIARQGYINLLPVQQKHSLNPGDTKEMLSARRRFLQAGYYLPIAESVSVVLQTYTDGSPLVVDVGCGEGYYTALMKQRCAGRYIGVDISKDGVKMACSADKEICWLVATASSLPLPDGQADAVTAMFSLLLAEEYRRILKPGGCVIEVTVGSDHLRELKEIIYDEVFEQHKHPAACPEGFREPLCEEHRFTLSLSNEPLRDLLCMTPHFWRIHQERREALEATGSLTVTVHYWVRVLQKI